jgi:hypothetical protein
MTKDISHLKTSPLSLFCFSQLSMLNQLGSSLVSMWKCQLMCFIYSICFFPKLKIWNALERKIKRVYWSFSWAFSFCLTDQIRLVYTPLKWENRVQWDYQKSYNYSSGNTKGEVSLYHWPPVWLVWISLFCK